ncbi:MAG TPA: serine hydrolase domain-containing protein [Bryobacteraceae bacterium]|nr:serine hydrolase domain-containing protein [Bryobacteraceae bacterium]
MIANVPPLLLSRRALLAASLAGTNRFRAAETILERAVASGQLHAAVLRVEHRGEVFERAYGKARPESPFLIASITKPMTATALMILADRGQLRYEDPASLYLPNFTSEERGRITIRHLLTHTSGLPDMLPDNIAMRQRRAPLADFVQGALTTPLLFVPGTKTSYQSMGILLAAEIAQRVTNKSLRDFLRAEVFRPLGMNRTALGLGSYKLPDVVPIQVEHADPPGGTPATESWDWNSPWWRDFGAPWGGAHSTAADITKLLRAFLHPTGTPVRKETALRMITNQNQGLDKPYGIGWSVTPTPFGHGGSTGTSCWADPAKDATFVLLTSLPAKASQKPIIDPVSKAVRAAV